MDAIIFDADHTLYIPETDRAYDEKFAFLAEETGVDADELSRAWAATVEEAKNGERDVVRRKALIAELLDRAGADPDPGLVEEAYDLFWETVIDDLTYDEGLEAMLQRLDEQCDVLAVATDEFPEALAMKLSTVFDRPKALFDDIVTPEDVKEMKPSTAFFRRILDRHGIAPEDALMVGDSWDRDLKPAAELGMTTVLVEGDTSHDPLEPNDNGDAAPDYRIDHITELEAILEEER